MQNLRLRIVAPALLATIMTSMITPNADAVDRVIVTTGTIVPAPDSILQQTVITCGTRKYTLSVSRSDSDIHINYGGNRNVDISRTATSKNALDPNSLGSFYFSCPVNGINIGFIGAKFSSGGSFKPISNTLSFSDDGTFSESYINPEYIDLPQFIASPRR